MGINNNEIIVYEEEWKERRNGIISTCERITNEMEKMVIEEKVQAKTEPQESWLVRNWKKIESKASIIIIFAIIVMDKVWVNQPDWVNEVLFWSGMAYAVLSSGSLQEALMKYNAWLEKYRTTKDAIAIAKAAMEVTAEEVDKAVLKINEILANDDPKKRQELIDVIKPLVNATVKGRDAIIIVCDKITEIDTT